MNFYVRRCRRCRRRLTVRQVESKNENVKGKRNGEQQKTTPLAHSMELKYTAVYCKTKKQHSMHAYMRKSQTGTSEIDR